MFSLPQLERAQEVVGQAMPPTPAHAWPLLSRRLGAAIGFFPRGLKILAVFDKISTERLHGAIFLDRIA